MKSLRRFSTSLRFLLRSLGQRWSKFSLALAAISVGVSLAATAIALRADLGRKMSSELRAYGPNVLVTGLSESDLPRLATALGSMGAASTAAVTPILYAGGQIEDEGANVAGLLFEPARSLFPSWRIEGHWPPGEHYGLVGARLAKRLNVKPLDRIPLVVNGKTMPVVVSGIVTSGEAEDDEVIVSLPALQEIAARPGEITVLAVRVDGALAGVTDVCRRIETAVPGSRAIAVTQVAAAEGELLSRLDLMMKLAGALILVMAALCVMTTLTSIVVEREEEIGLMRALGGGDGEVLLMLLGEATLLGVFGGLFGFLLGLIEANLVGHQLFHTAIEPRIEVLPMVMALSVGLSWIGVALPLRRALHIQPATALRGE